MNASCVHGTTPAIYHFCLSIATQISASLSQKRLPFLCQKRRPIANAIFCRQQGFKCLFLHLKGLLRYWVKIGRWKNSRSPCIEKSISGLEKRDLQWGCPELIRAEQGWLFGDLLRVRQSGYLGACNDMLADASRNPNVRLCVFVSQYFFRVLYAFLQHPSKP